MTLNLREMTAEYEEEGYANRTAEARVCQDVILEAISKGAFKRHITVKGGVVMRSITGDVRRATVDLDLDFIRYSLSDHSIRSFVDKLNCLDGIQIEIRGEIEELSQQEYSGKRVFVRISDDFGNSLDSKIDLGVHTYSQIEQKEHCFDVCLDDDGASLLMNSGEQLFAEKLRSLLRHGPLSTRFKDIYDFCYLSDHIDRDRLLDCIDILIFRNSEFREDDMDAVIQRVRGTFTNRIYLDAIKKQRKRIDWLGIGSDVAFQKVLDYLESLR